MHCYIVINLLYDLFAPITSITGIKHDNNGQNEYETVSFDLPDFVKVEENVPVNLREA